MKKLFKIWHSGGDFDERSLKLSSNNGILSHRGVAVAFCYKSEIFQKRYIVCTIAGEKLIRLNREAIIVSDLMLCQIINDHISGSIDSLNQSLMHNGCAPAKFTFNILIKYSNFPRYIPFLKTFTKRFTVLTTEKLSADMRAQCLYEPTQNYNPYFWYTLNDPQELALILLWGQDIKVIDLEKVKQAIEEDLRKKLIVHQAI